MTEDEQDLSNHTPERATPSSILGQHESMLLYGQGGTGKTFTAATAPEPQWWLTPGGKGEIKTAFSPRFLKKHGRKEIFVSSVHEDRERGQMVDNPSGFDRCCLAVDSMLEWNDKEGIGIQTLVVDNATRIEEYMMNKAIMAEYILAGNQEKSVLSHERKYGIRRPHDSTWGAAQSLMDPFVNWLIELPFHIVFVAHTYENWEQIPNTRKRRLVSVLPLFVGQQRTSIPNKFDNVWYALTSGGGRSQVWGIQSERSEIELAKTRVGGILSPDFERDPDIEAIIQQFAAHGQSLEQE